MNIANILIKIRKFSAKRFDVQTKNPMKAQKELLFNILKNNADTLFGKKHNFSSIKTIKDFQKNVEVNNYETLYPYIKRMLHGEDNILIKERPIFYGITSGTTSKPKFIPVTKSSRRQKKEIMDLWIYHLVSDHPKATSRKTMVIVSPAIEGYTKSGIAYGSESGDAYKCIPSLIRSRYVLPYEVFCIKDYEARYYTILRLGLEADVSNIGTMNPSTILILCQKIEKHAKDIVEDIRKGTLNASLNIDKKIRSKIERGLKPNPARAHFLNQLLKEKGALLPRDFWPNLALIECWTGGTVGLYLQELIKYFNEDICVRDFGYLSTEARCSMPISDFGPSGILTISSNFYEFIPEEDIEKQNPRYITVDGLQKGKRYLILFTTTSGLYRYNIDDIIKVVGFYNSTPVIEFVQKGKNVSSATGEKLYENQVVNAVNKAAETTGIGVEFFYCCLEWGMPPRYLFLVEFIAEHTSIQKKNFLKTVEESLGKINIEYKTKRASQRLGDPSLKVLEKGSFEKFRMAKLALVQHDSQFKASHLSRDFKIPSEFKIVEEIKL